MASGTVARGWQTRGGRTAGDTLKRMADAVRRDVETPEVLEGAAAIVADVSGRDSFAQVARIADWVRAHTAFLRDPRPIEVLRGPVYMLEDIARDGVAQGDCDDVAMLAAALAQAIGIPARFIAEGYVPGGPLAHVYTVLQTPAGWLAIDTQRPPGMMRQPTRQIALNL